MRNFNSNSFEHDYIIKCLESFIVDLKTDKPLAQIIDFKAVQITAFMQGQIVSEVKHALEKNVITELVSELTVNECKDILNILENEKG